MKIKKILNDEDGVSPVIGVILMVAITVILAAVVAGFVFGAVEMPGATPTASIGVDSVEPEDNMTILVHESGSSLTGDETRVIITNLDEEGDVSGSVVLGDLDDFGENRDEWRVGERVSIYTDSNNGGDLDEGVPFDSGDDLEIRVVDIPSGGTISSRTITA